MQSEYQKQLKKGCEKKCIKVFCKSCSSTKCAKDLSMTLSVYGNAFLCQEIKKIVKRNSCEAAKYLDRGCVILDYMFYIFAFLDEADCYDKIVTVDNESSNQNENELYFGKKESNDKKLLNTENTNEIQEDKKLETKERIKFIKKFDHFEKCVKHMKIKENHAYCQFLCKTEFSDEEVHLCEGAMYLLLEKFKITSNYFLRPFIIRLFAIVCRHKKLNPYYSKILTKVFYDMQSMYEEMMEIKKLDLPDGICPRGNKCFINPIFTFDDYKTIKKHLSKTLEKIINLNIKEDRYLEEMLNIFKILYLINEKIKVFSYEDFYLKNFSRRINIHEEYCQYKNKEKSIFNYTFVLSLTTKSDFIKYENSDLVKESLQETFFRALFEGEKVPYFFIKINRNTIYSQTLKLFRKTPNFDLRKQVKVIFNKEEGEDQGGIKKEYFQLLSEEIREDKRLFVTNNNVLWFKMNASPQRPEYECIGKIIGVALYNNVVLNLPFPTLFFKRLLDKETELDDLKEIDETMYNSLKNFSKMDETEISHSEQTFFVSYQSGETIIEKKLIKNGDKIPVTKDNLGIFIDKYVKFITSESIEQYIRPIRKGFLSVIQPTSFEFLHARELEKIIVGSKIINLDFLRDTCIYRGYDQNDDIPVWFWDIISAYDDDKRKKLIQFITGNDRIPVTGATLRIVIMKNGCDTERLPSAQTCFNIIMLPEYSSKKKLEKKLDLAVSYTKGFFLV